MSGQIEERSLEHDEVLVPPAAIGAIPVRVTGEDKDEGACSDRRVMSGIAVAAGAGCEEGEAPGGVPTGGARRKAATFSTGLSKSMGGQAQRPSLRTFR